MTPYQNNDIPAHKWSTNQTQGETSCHTYIDEEPTELPMYLNQFAGPNTQLSNGLDMNNAMMLVTRAMCSFQRRVTSVNVLLQSL